MTTTRVTATKRGRAVNGDLFTLRHPTLAMSAPFTSFVDVSFGGITHQIFSARDRRAFNFANTTGTFALNGFQGFVIENLDTVETQVAHRYQAIVESDTGVLTSWSYVGTSHLLELMGALQLTDSPLGMAMASASDVEITSAPRVALTLDFGVLEVTPLTAEVIERLPDWQGSPVAAGELYASQVSDGAPVVTLVAPTCRVVALPNDPAVVDHIVEVLADLDAEWRA